MNPVSQIPGTIQIIPRRYQVRYMNIPGLDKPIQNLNVLNAGGYAQDEWRPMANLTITGGVRVDVPAFDNSQTYPNPNADALTFRDEAGQPVKYSSGSLPDPKLLFSPRVGFNWDVAGDQRTQVRGGIGVFTGAPLYVWISNQIGNTGLLQGSLLEDNPTTRPFNPDVNKYKPVVTGAPAASYELDVTDNNFKFPQVLRNNIAVDRKLPWGIVGTAEFIYNKDVNGIYYINANLPPAQSAFTGVDARPRWVGTACAAPTPGPCVTRINNAAGNQVTATYVLKNQSIGDSWNISGMLSKSLYHGLTMKGAYSYGDAHNTIDPGSTASSSSGLNEHKGDPNNPGVGRSQSAQGHRVFLQTSYTRSYFGFGATSVAAFWEMKPALIGAGGGLSTNSSYVFAGDMNGDGGSGNDLIYIPKNTAEMNFVPFTVGTTTFSADA